MKFLVLTVFLFSSASLAKDNVGYSLYFQTLTELPESETLNYIKSFRQILSQNLSYELAQTLQTTPNSICLKRKKKTCHPGLYGENICIAKSQKTSIGCAEVGKRKRFSSFFSDPAFHRVSWNSLGIRINKVCSKKKNFSCIKLFQLKKKTLIRNRKHLQRQHKTKISK